MRVELLWVIGQPTAENSCTTTTRLFLVMMIHKFELTTCQHQGYARRTEFWLLESESLNALLRMAGQQILLNPYAPQVRFQMKEIN